MSDDADLRLHRLLGGEALAGLRRKLRRRFERISAAAPSGTMKLAELTAAEHEALALLTGRPARSRKSLLIDLASLDAALARAGLAVSLRAALEQLDGPIADKAAIEQDKRERWSAVAAGGDHGGLATFLATGAGLGLLKRLARQDTETADHICDAARAVLRRLPAAGLPRAGLAADTLGDAHALDTGRPVATLVLAVLRRSSGEPATDDAGEEGAGEEREAADGTERARSVWARAGILVNELARPALLLNLPVRAGAPLAEPGEPAYVSLRQLLRSPPLWDVDGRTIHVCENPNLLAIAADRLGSGCRPLVSTDGMPAAAQRTLLGQLAAAGARLYYHGDFDWPGLRIAGRILADFPARPWRFFTEDYEHAVTVLADYRQTLVGAALDVGWDERLGPAMRRIGLAVPEEALAEQLLADLG